MMVCSITTKCEINGVKWALHSSPRVDSLVNKLKRKYRIRFKEDRTKSKLQRAE